MQLLSEVHLLRVNITLLSKEADVETAEITTCAVMQSKPEMNRLLVSLLAMKPKCEPLTPYIKQISFPRQANDVLRKKNVRLPVSVASSFPLCMDINLVIIKIPISCHKTISCLLS